VTAFFAGWPPALLLLQAALVLGAFFLMFRSGSYYRRTFGQVERRTLAGQPISALSVYSPAGPAPRLATVQMLKPAARKVMNTIVPAFVLFLILWMISPSVAMLADGNNLQTRWLLRDAVVLTMATDKFMALDLLSLRTAFVQMTYVFCGALFVGIWLWRERRGSQSYYLVLGALLLGLSALGASLGFLIPVQGFAQTVTFFLPALAHFWAALLLCGSALILAGLLDHLQLVRVLGRPAMEGAS
jgi:hypothetical protein